MSSNIITKILLIDNMSCVNCENIIERVLTNVPGITSVTASYSKGLATLTYDEAIINLERIVEILAAENYKVKTDNSGILTGGKESDTNEDMVIKKSSRWKRTNSNQKDTKTIYDNGSKNTRDYSDLIGVIIIIIALYLIANQFGLSNIIN